MDDLATEHSAISFRLPPLARSSSRTAIIRGLLEAKETSIIPGGVWKKRRL
jgi:hypothetical protein